MSADEGARIGIDLGGTKIEGVRLASNGVISERIRAETPRNDYRGTITAIVEVVEQLDTSGRLKVGVGAPGSWVAHLGRMQNCNSTWLNGRPLLDDLNRALSGRVRLANDADCFALSEARGGSAQVYQTVFGAILGTGVGGGIVVGDRLLSGPNGLTGEWGHTPMTQSDANLGPRVCYCGRLDCVETYLSGPGLLMTHKELWPAEPEPPETAQAIYERAGPAVADEGWWEGVIDHGDGAGEAAAIVRATSTLALYCRMLAENLARIVNTLDPDAIVLGGGLSQMHEIYAPVRKLMAAHVFGEVFETALLAPAFGATSGGRGAAWLWAPGEA